MAATTRGTSRIDPRLQAEYLSHLARARTAIERAESRDMDSDLRGAQSDLLVADEALSDAIHAQTWFIESPARQAERASRNAGSSSRRRS